MLKSPNELLKSVLNQLKIRILTPIAKTFFQPIK